MHPVLAFIKLRQKLLEKRFLAVEKSCTSGFAYVFTRGIACNISIMNQTALQYPSLLLLELDLVTVLIN